MKEIKVEQGTPEWLAWRKSVITATDASCIMGNNPWTTPYKCWQRKLGLIDEKKCNQVMERGKILEPEARAQFMEKYDLIMEPMVVESTEFEFLGASLDGITLSGTKILEIKCGGEKLHSMASKGIIPDYYMDQMQHQLLVTGAERCYYYSYNGKDGICIEVEPDPDFIHRFMPKARAFWRNVAFFEPPSLQDSDFISMNDNLAWEEYAKMYLETNASIKALEQKKDYLRKKIIELCADQNCAGKGIKVVKTIIKGRIAYEEIPTIQDIDLEKFRKNSTTTWKILVDEKK